MIAARRVNGERNTAHLPGKYAALGYRSASVARGSGRALPTAGGADRHLREDRELLVRMGAEFSRDNSIYQGIRERALDGILGKDGFSLQARTSSKRMNSYLEEAWSEFCRAPEVRGIFSFDECERLALGGVFDHGDIGVAMFDAAEAFQYFESEQIYSLHSTSKGEDGNYISEGVEMNALGRPLRYFVHAYDAWGQLRRGKGTPIDAADFRLVANRRRVSQTRGVPVLTAAFSMLHRINDVCDAEAIAWQLLSRFAVIVNRANAAEAGYAESKQDDDGRDAPADLADRVVELDSAIMFNAEVGEDMKAIARDLPGANFPESVRMYLRLIGMPLGLPLEIILLDYSKTNYTGSRAALEQAFSMFIRWQRFLMREHHTPLYERWLTWQIEEGRVDFRADIFKHTWTAPEFPWIDQLKEAQAWGERMDRGLATQTMALASVGADREEFLDARSREIQDAMAKAREINAANADMPPVDWRMLVGLPVGTTEMAVRAGSEPAAPEPAAEDVANADD